jgi:hypothetical protein
MNTFLLWCNLTYNFHFISTVQYKKRTAGISVTAIYVHYSARGDVNGLTIGQILMQHFLFYMSPKNNIL